MISARQAAERLGVTPRQVRRLVAAGKLVATPLGATARAPLVIDEASLDRLITERLVAPPRPGRPKQKGGDDANSGDRDAEGRRRQDDDGAQSRG